MDRKDNPDCLDFFASVLVGAVLLVVASLVVLSDLDMFVVLVELLVVLDLFSEGRETYVWLDTAWI